MKTPSSIRAKVSLASTLVSALAMLAIVLSAAHVTKSVLSDSIETTLESHLDAVQVDLESGATDFSIGGTGSELIQVVDANGAVIAASDWAWGVSAMAEGCLAPGEERRAQHEQLQLTRSDSGSPAGSSEDPDLGEGSEAAGSNTGSSSQGGGASSAGKYGSSTNVYDATHDDDDDDDESDDDDDDDSDDGHDDDEAEDEDDKEADEREGSEMRKSVSAAGSSNASAAASRTAAFSFANPFAASFAYADTPSEGQELSASSLLGDEGPFVVIERGVSTPNGPVTMMAMASLAPAVEASRAVVLVLSVIAVITVACVAVFSWLMARRTLRPVVDMRARVEEITANDLSLRIPVPQGDPDLSALAATFNGMIERVERAMAEQRRFISDASHELKSPVAATRIMIDAARAHPDAVDEQALLRDLSYENERMGGIVGNLLLLAQHDERGRCAERHPIDLCDLIFEECSALGVRTQLKVDTAGVEPVVCAADSVMIRRALRNLLDNAARYATSTVKVSCAEDAGRVRMMVSDDGPGVLEQDRERAFGRFVRLEEGRDRKRGSTGLGLAVVRTIAQDHGGSAYFGDSECGGATVVLEFEA